MLGALALALYAVIELGLDGLWDPDHWWQSVAVWFVGAAVVHDLVLFPVYAAIDRLVTSRRSGSAPSSPTWINHVRVPLLAAALTFFVFLPGIVEQGSDAHLRATGLDQDPYLGRWLLLVSGLATASAVLFVVRRVLHRRGGH
jgi:hypothetical protein